MSTVSVKTVDIGSQLKICLAPRKTGQGAISMASVLENTEDHDVEVTRVEALGNMRVSDFGVINRRGNDQDAAIPQIGSDAFPPGMQTKRVIRPHQQGIIVVKVEGVSPHALDRGFSITVQAPHRAVRTIKGGYWIKAGCP